jgi:RNA recognition motif-containing protein
MHKAMHNEDNRDSLDSPNLCQLFVGGIPPRTSKEELQSYFGQKKFGELLECRMIKDKTTSTSE